MAKSKGSNYLDQAIFRLATEFQKIPNYHEKMKDDELRAIHTFVAVGIAGIIESRNLVVASFVPATNKAIVNTRKMLKESVYADVLKNMDDSLDDLRDETIRLGYVFTFHKFESFIKQLIRLLDERLDAATNISLDKFAEKEFGFNPFQWYKCPSVHLVNFISNCTKHQGGFCRMDNPKNMLPDEFSEHSPNQKIVRSSKQYQADIQLLIGKITPLIKALMSLYMYQRVVHLMSGDPFDKDISAQALGQINNLKPGIGKEIEEYCK